MTTNGPFGNPEPDRSREPAPPVSWSMPITIGALTTMFIVLFYGAAASLVPLLGPVLCCGAPITYGMPAGFVPVALAFRMDPKMTPGQGFSLAFISAGAGNVILALLTVMNSGDVSPAELAAAIRQTLEDAVAQGHIEITAEQMEQFVQSAVAWIPYLPILLAAALTIFGALSGLIAVKLLRRRVPPGTE